MDIIKEKIHKLEKIALIAVAVCSLTGGLIFGYITSEIKNYSGIHNLKKFQPSIPTRLYDVNGELIAELFREKMLKNVSLSPCSLIAVLIPMHNAPARNSSR